MTKKLNKSNMAKFFRTVGIEQEQHFTLSKTVRLIDVLQEAAKNDLGVSAVVTGTGTYKVVPPTTFRCASGLIHDIRTGIAGISNIRAYESDGLNTINQSTNLLGLHVNGSYVTLEIGEEDLERLGRIMILQHIFPQYLKPTKNGC